MQPQPWPDLPISRDNFQRPPREYGILPFWFLNGELDPDEMRYQLREFREKGMPGIILHARYGLEMPYIGDKYLERIAFAVEEAKKLGLQTWIYDEMNWPSGTADKRVLQARPDLTQKYIECLNFPMRGPWFTYMTGADSRYNDFERSRPLASFAISSEGQIVDLTPNLSFENVIPWQAPPGNWRIMFIVEKEADYYIDALNPEATAEFLRLGYEPYARAVGDNMSSQMLGFYTDEPAMHYYVTAGDNPIVPWTKDMLRRFQARNGYNLRPCLPHLFFDISPDSARVRYDFYNTLTDFYSDAYYRQIHEWCQQRGVLFTGHLLYEEWLRRLIRVEGNAFKHYRHLDVTGVDHLYPFIGNRDRPDEHVAMKLGSSAAHQVGSLRLLCESFGGIFMDATMQRMKWITDWEYVLGVNLLNPHGFHYTLEGSRKRDWPPSMFYQYPWWSYYSTFSEYVSRLSHLLSRGRHVAKVAVLWPINALMANFTPQANTPLAERTVNDFNALTDLLLRVHYDYDYLDEDALAGADVSGGQIRVHNEAYELVILPPMTHLKIETVNQLEAFVTGGGRVLGAVYLPNQAFTEHGLLDISERVQTLFGVEPGLTQRDYLQQADFDLISQERGAGKTAFLRTYGLFRQLPARLQHLLGTPGRSESPLFVVEPNGDDTRYFFAPEGGTRQDITTEVSAERQAVMEAVEAALQALVPPDVTIDNPEVFYLHCFNDNRDIYFLVNPTRSVQVASVTLTGEAQPILWNPSTGEERLIAPVQIEAGRTRFEIELPPVGSAFVLTQPAQAGLVSRTNLTIERFHGQEITGYGRVERGFVNLNGRDFESDYQPLTDPVELDGEWEFEPQSANALVLRQWLVTDEADGTQPEQYAAPGADTSGWLPMVAGAWSYQLPAEPDRPYPIPVWYRIPFSADYVPPRLDLIVDGFAGSEWQLFVNGQRVTSTLARSAIDAQMQAVDITPYVRQGDNLIALRLVVTNATDGLLDLLKLMGDFALESRDGSYAMTEPRRAVQPDDWTAQGYPYFSGRGLYRLRFNVPAAFAGQRVFLEPHLFDDALEVRVNGQTAGVRLWTPYTVEVTELLQPGDNVLELVVANTLVNLLEATPRLSGLAGAPQLVPYPQFTFQLE